MTVRVNKRYSPAMRGITVAAAVAALTMTGAGAAQAWHVPWGHQRIHAAALQPIGACKADPDHIGGSTCEISILNYGDGHGVDVRIQNFNPYPVRIDIDYAYDCNAPGGQTLQHTSQRVPFGPLDYTRTVTFGWATGSTQLCLSFSDGKSGRSLGGKVVDRP